MGSATVGKRRGETDVAEETAGAIWQHGAGTLFGACHCRRPGGVRCPDPEGLKPPVPHDKLETRCPRVQNRNNPS